MDQYLGLIELLLVFAGLIVGGAVLAAQGRRLDRLREARNDARREPPP
ncbi:MAG TPA: hypothetical protein VGC77_03020 [Rhodopseudomonas sp.]